MNEELQKLLREVKQRTFNVKEYISRSEGAVLFTQAINTMLVQGLQPELPDAVNQLFTTIPLNGRRNINFPSVRGFVPDLVHELAEFKFVDQDYTSITVEPSKFGMRLGYSRKMLDDNEVGLMGWRALEVGRSHRQLRRREAIKAMSFFSTGPSTTTGIIGIRNHGLFYPQGGYSNFISATALPWENIIALAMRTLKSQTITVADMTIEFPVTPNFVLANPHHEMSVKKVLNASITVVGTGVGINAATQGANVAGSNVFGGSIPIQIFDPAIPTGQALIGAAGRGTVWVERDPLQVDEETNLAYDAVAVRSRERFLPAVIENRFICDIQM